MLGIHSVKGKGAGIGEPRPLTPRPVGRGLWAFLREGEYRLTTAWPGWLEIRWREPASRGSPATPLVGFKGPEGAGLSRSPNQESGHEALPVPRESERGRGREAAGVDRHGAGGAARGAAAAAGAAETWARCWGPGGAARGGRAPGLDQGVLPPLRTREGRPRA